MVRSYQRKTNRGNYGSDNLKSALTSVQEGMTLSKASKIYGVQGRRQKNFQGGANKNGASINH